MVNTIRSSSRSFRLNSIVLVAFLLFAGFLLFKLFDSSEDIIHSQYSETNPKSDSSSDLTESAVFASYICDILEPSKNRSPTLQSYCGKIPVPLSGWSRAEKYSESDIGFLIFTDSIFSHTKVTALRDTWLSRVTHKYFLSERSYSWLPITVIDRIGSDQMSNAKRIFSGLRTIHTQQKRLSHPHKWYYLGTSDTFINVPHALKRLDSYDYTKPFFLGDHSNLTVCLDNDGQKTEIEYPSIDAGLFISSKLLALMMPHLTDDRDNIGSENIDGNAHVALSCLISKLGIQLTNMSGYWTLNADRSLEIDGETEVPEDPEPNNFHSVSPIEMYDLDEFYSFLHVDRLVNDHNWKDLTEYIRTFLSNHYESLRMKRAECPSPEIEPRN